MEVGSGGTRKKKFGIRAPAGEKISSYSKAPAALCMAVLGKGLEGGKGLLDSPIRKKAFSRF